MKLHTRDPLEQANCEQLVAAFLLLADCAASEWAQGRPGNHAALYAYKHWKVEPLYKGHSE